MPDPARSASVVIHDGRGKVLLARRSTTKSYAPGQWETVGGQIEPGESPLEALHREVTEELGKGVSLVDVEFLGKYRFESELGLLLSEVYTAGIAGEPVAAPREIEELRWFTKDQALALNFCVNCRDRVADFFASRGP